MSDGENKPDANASQGGGPAEGGTAAGGMPGGHGSLADLKALGRYEIIRELGRGAMGIVFEAVDPKIGRKVALKVLTSVPGVTDSELEEFRSRFFREARTAGMLSHPNIVVIHDVDHDEDLGISYMAMEYLKGQTLYDLLRSGVKFTREQAIDLCIQVAEGLDHAHRQGIIHRDVKPANLMLLEDGTVKITDFGIAKISTSNLTKTGQFLGTPNYMSPEQVIGHVIDGRSDLFGLGIILYELLTGEKPFMGSSLTTITYQIVNVDPIEPSKIQPGIPKVFDEIVGRLLKKAPDERYQTGKEVAEVLRAARDSQGGGAGVAASPRSSTAAEPTLATTRPASSKITAVATGETSAAAPSGGPFAGLGESLPSGRWLLIGITAVFLLVTAVLVAIMLPDDETPPAGEPPAVQTAQGGEPPAAVTPAAEPGGTAEDPVGAAEPGASGATPPEQPPAEPSPEPSRTPEPAPKPQPKASEPAPKPAPREPEPKPREPEPEPKLVPKQAEPLPLNPTKKPAAEPAASRLARADVTLRFEHKLKAGVLAVEVDDEPVASYSFQSDKKKGGSLLESFPVLEGTHTVRVCLESEDMKDGTICAHRQHRFVMNTNATIRALHQKPPLGRDKFSFEIE